MFSNAFWRSLPGMKQLQAIVGAGVAYSDSPTYDHFVANAVEGEIGFYNADTGALLSTAISNTVRFFVALKRDGRVHKTTPVLAGDIKKHRVTYSAPTKQKVDVFLGTKATLTVGNIKYTAREGGTAGNAITVTVVDPAGNNASLSVSVTGTDITINLATDGSSNPTSTGQDVLDALLAKAEVMALVTVEGTGTMSTVQAAASKTNLSGGTSAAAPTAGKEYGITIIDLTPATQPFPTYNYSYVAKTGDSLADVITELESQINDTTSFVNRDRDLVVTATASDTLLTIEAKEIGTHFKVQFRETMLDIADVLQLENSKQGSGYYEQVKALEEAGDIFAGWTTNYPETHTIPEDYGKPTSLVLSTNTYNLYGFTVIKSEPSRMPHNFWMNQQYFVVAVPSNGTNPSSALNTLLGF